MKKPDGKQPKYRGEKILANSLLRLQDTERTFIANELLSCLTSTDSVIKETAGIVSLCFSLGLSIDEVLALEIKKRFSKNFDLYEIPCPLGDHQWTPTLGEEPLFDHVFTSISLPIISPLSKWLNELKPAVAGPRLNSFFETPPKVIVKRVKRLVTRFRKEFSSNITLPRISASYKSEIYFRHQDNVIAYLLLGKSKYLPPHTRHYYVPSRHKIYETWCDAQADLWGERPVSQAGLLSMREWNGWVIESSMLKSFIGKISVLPDQSDPVVFHNDFTRYVICMLIWNLGQRAVRDPFCEIDKLCLISRRVLILDKYKHGYDNLRLLPLPSVITKQLTYYFAHLENLGNKLEHSAVDFKHLQSFRQYLQHLIAGKDRSNKRLFFLINKETGQLEPITPSRVEGWLRTNGLPVKSNFGRHYMATRFMADGNITFEQAQFFLGHSLREKTHLYSEAKLDAVMAVLEQGIDAVMIGDGWKAIKGFRFRTREIINRQNHHKIDPSFYPVEEPGFVERARNQESKSERVKDLSNEIIWYLTYITKLEDNGELKRDEEREAEFRTRLWGLDFPYHRGWSDIKRVIREEFDSKNPLPEILKFQNLSSGVSSLTGRMLKKSLEADHRIYTWVTWLNSSLIDYLNTDDFCNASIKRRAALIVNAAVLGGVHKRQTLFALANNREDKSRYAFKLYQTQSISHVEIYIKETWTEDGESFEEESWFDRWIPDPLSVALLNENDQELTNAKVMSEVKRLVNIVQIPLTLRSPLKSLPRATASYTHRAQPLYQYGIASGKVTSRPQSLNSFARHLGQKPLPPEYSIIEGSLEVQDQPETFDDSNTDRTIATLENIKKQIQSICNQAETIESATRVYRCHFIDARLTQLEGRIKGAPFTIGLFFAWARYLTMRGTRGESKSGKIRLKAGTIGGYISQLFTRLFIDELIYEESFPYIESMTATNVTEFFVRVVDREKGKSSAIQLKRLLHLFHRFTRDNFGVHDCDWDTVNTVPLKYRPPKNGEIIGLLEYEQLLTSMLAEKNSDTVIEKLSSIFVSIMMFRFGLRPSEAFKIMPTELLFDSDQNLKMVLVTKSFRGETKTRKGVRRVPCSQALSSWEVWTIRNLFERALAYSKIYPYFTLTNISYRSETNAMLSHRMSESARFIGTHLKKVTGDFTLSAYVLRHSFLSHTAANVIEYHPMNQRLQSRYLQLANTQFLGEASHNKKLKILAMMAGHRSEATTLRTYIHCPEIMNATNFEALDNVKDEVYAFLLGKSLPAYRTHKHRLKSHQATVEASVSKSSTPVSTKRPNSKAVEHLGFDKHLIQTPNLIQIAEFILVKSKRRIQSKTSLYNDDAFRQIAISINTLQTETNLKSILDMFSGAPKTQLMNLFDFLDDSAENLEGTLSKKPFRRQLKAQLGLWIDVRNPKDGKWVVLNENELKSVLSMTRNLGVFLTPCLRHSSYQTTCQKKNIEVKHFNHSSNGTHPIEVRKKTGYEVVFKKETQLRNIKAVNLFLTLISIYLQMY